MPPSGRGSDSTGDTFYPGWLFAFISGLWVESNLEDYLVSLQRLAALLPEVDYLYRSHVTAIADPQVLPEVVKALIILIDRSGTYHENVTIFGQERTVHHFDGFSTVTKNDW